VTNRFAATTNRGRVRARNEDNFLFVNLTRSSPPLDGSSVTSAGIADQNDVLMILVADGMGGQARGDLASRTVIEHFTRYAEAHSASLLSASGSVKTMQKILCTEVKRCHATLRRRSEWPELRGMGTTATIAVVAWPKLFVAHVGDSRCYLFCEDRSRQITRDHSLAQYFVDQGSMEASLGDKSPFRHKLWNVLGGDTKDVTVDFHDVDLQENDAMLLCTDGLTNRLSNVQLVDNLRTSTGVVEICGSLVAAANAAGGQDNITCAVVRFAAKSTSLSAAECFRNFASQNGNSAAK